VNLASSLSIQRLKRLPFSESHRRSSADFQFSTRLEEVRHGVADLSVLLADCATGELALGDEARILVSESASNLMDLSV
jgi:hypothetical protein